MTDVRCLPGPGSDFWDWQLHAACRGRDTEQFFHPENERGPRRLAREGAAHALRTREPYGIWGGLSETERDEILGARRRAS